MSPWTVHEDVARAETLDKAFYLDPALQPLQAERLFARSWQWLGDTHALREPGQVEPRTLLSGCLDEPLLLSRDAQQLRVLSNVCTHRGKRLLDAPLADQQQIRCGYHGRRFALDGTMLHAPGFQHAQDFPRPCDHLAAPPWFEWGGHAFVAVGEPLAAAAEVFGPIQQRLAPLPLQDFRHDPASDRDYVFDAHWALYVENYLEGLHIPFIHPGLTAALDLGNYRYEQQAWSNLQLALARPGDLAFEPAPGLSEQGQRVAAYYYWVFPNLMLNFYPWGLSLNQVIPVGPARTCVRFRAYVWKPELRGQGAGGALDEVELEDEAAVVSVQQGLRSRFYQRGRYAPGHEALVHQFHRLVAQAMG